MGSGNSNNQIKTSWNFLEALNGTSPFENWKHIVFASGIEIIASDLVTGRACESFCSIDESAPIIFSFNLSGDSSGEFSLSMRKKGIITCESGETIISFAPESHWKSNMFACQHYRALNIYIAPNCLCEILENEPDCLPAGLHEMLQNQGTPRAQVPFLLKRKISPLSLLAVNQILNCPYKGVLGRLYLECKCLELLISQLADMAQGPTQNCLDLPLHPLDRERIHFAREILFKDMGNFSSLHELAKKSGLNENKLNQGFRQEFGMTVYQYYQRCRIIRAQELLDEGRLDLDSTAQILGFSDTSHFIKQFKKYFGITPGAYMKSGLSRQ